MIYYQHRQIGYLIITTCVIALFYIAYRVVINGFDLELVIVLTLVLVVMIIFSTLTVIIKENTLVKDDILQIQFSLGLLKKRFSIKCIDSCQIVKNPWYCGWGIRWGFDSWLYNVSGFDAIEIKTINGSVYRIGTDTPNDLEKAINHSIERVDLIGKNHK